jgi:hypothetical protein
MPTFQEHRFIRCPLPRHVAVEVLWQNCSNAMLRRCVGSPGAEDPAAKTSLLASTRPSDRPTLPFDQGVGSSGVEGFVLARLCPYSDCRVIRCYCLRCSSSAIHPAHLQNGSSVHPTVPIQFGLLRSVPSTPMLAFTVPSVHPMVTFLPLSFRGFDPWKIYYLLNLTCGILTSLGPRNVYKDMLNNMVSPIDHVMNHQNQTRTNGKWGHVRYTLTHP